MNRTFTILIGILFFIALGGFAFFFTPNTPSVPEETGAMTPFTSETHNFSLSYPADLSILEYTDDMAAIGTLIEGGIASIAEIRVAVVEGAPGESFMDAATRDLANLCDADGPTSSFSCTGVDRVTPFAAASGATGFEVYLKGELRDLASGSVEDVRKGPYYGFLLGTNARASKVLIVHAPLNLNADEADTAAIRSIAESVTVR